MPDDIASPHCIELSLFTIFTLHSSRKGGQALCNRRLQLFFLPFDDIVEGFHVILKGLVGQIFVAGDIDDGTMGIKAPYLVP